MPLARAIDDLLPTIMGYVAAHRDAFLAEFTTPVERMLARGSWWIFIRLLPRGIRLAYDFYLRRYATMTVGDFLAELARDLRTLTPVGAEAGEGDPMDWHDATRLAIVSVQAALTLAAPGTPLYFILALVLAILQRLATPQAVGAIGPDEMPPKEDWTPEGVAAWAEAKAQNANPEY
jgi:hypothetical protein